MWSDMYLGDFRSGLLLSSLLFIFLLVHESARAQELPGGLVILPQDAEVFSIPGETTVNGVPSRLWGFQSWRKPADIADAYVRRWGAPITREVVADAIVLGKMVGDSFITVKLKSITSGGTQGILSVMDLRSAGGHRQRLLNEAEIWRQRIGVDAKLIDFSYSTDSKVGSMLLVFSAGGTVEYVARRASQYLQELGFVVEREMRSKPDAVVGNASRGSSLVSLYKRPDGAESQVTVHARSGGPTYATINLITKR